MKKINSLKALIFICVLVGFYVNNPKTLWPSSIKILISLLLLAVSAGALVLLFRKAKHKKIERQQLILLSISLIVSGFIFVYFLLNK